MPMTEDQERWAEAIAIERLHGERAKAWVAERIVETKKAGNKVVVVASAMGDTTDELLDLAHDVDAAATQRFFDGVCDGLLMVGGARNIHERLG